MRIIRPLNANTNDSHVDYHMHFWIYEREIGGIKVKPWRLIVNWKV